MRAIRPRRAEERITRKTIREKRKKTEKKEKKRKKTLWLFYYFKLSREVVSPNGPNI